jgi:hypothetical protein
MGGITEIRYSYESLKFGRMVTLALRVEKYSSSYVEKEGFHIAPLLL